MLGQSAILSHSYRASVSCTLQGARITIRRRITRCLPNPVETGPPLAQSWPNIEPAIGRSFVTAGKPYLRHEPSIDHGLRHLNYSCHFCVQLLKAGSNKHRFKVEHEPICHSGQESKLLKGIERVLLNNIMARCISQSLQALTKSY